MKLLSTLKTLPLISVLALGMALSPTVSMADNDKRGHDKKQYSRDGGKSHVKSHKRNTRPFDHKRESRGHNKHGDKHRSSHYRGNGHGYGHGKHHKAYKHNNYGHHGHNHTNVIVRDYGAYDYARRHYLSLDDLRFTFGLHGDNFDFILRD